MIDEAPVRPEVMLAEIVCEKRELQAELKKVDEQIEELESKVLSDWQADGITSMKVTTTHGPYLLYQSIRTYAKLILPDAERVRDSWPALMTINYAKSGSLLAEMMATGNEEGLANLAAAGIVPNEVTKINVKKS